jgi:hypothetical protein
MMVRARAVSLCAAGLQGWREVPFCLLMRVLHTLRTSTLHLAVVTAVGLTLCLVAHPHCVSGGVVSALLRAASQYFRRVGAIQALRRVAVLAPVGLCVPLCMR